MSAPATISGREIVIRAGEFNDKGIAIPGFQALEVTFSGPLPAYWAISLTRSGVPTSKIVIADGRNTPAVMRLAVPSFNDPTTARPVSYLSVVCDLTVEFSDANTGAALTSATTQVGG